MVGYLLLDSLVGNTDRHHENWGVLALGTVAGLSVELAPSFDHASSLGRENTDDRRCRLLEELDHRATVEIYCSKGRSPFFSLGSSPRALSPRDAFGYAQRLLPEAAAGWLDQLQKAPMTILNEAILSLPQEVATDTAKRFASAVLQCNYTFLLNS